MSSEIGSLLLIVGAAAAAALAGGLIPVFYETSDRLRGYLLHFAAGILFAVISVEIWPEIYRLDRAWAMIGGLLVGAGAMIALNTVTRRIEHRSEGGAFGLIVGTGVDSVVDGLLIGIGYAAEPSLGILLAVGFAAEKFTTSMTMAAEMRAGGSSRLAIAACATVIAAMLIPAAAAGMILLADPSSRAHTFMLAMAAAALLYIVTAELIARGQKTHDTTMTIAIFFAGYIGLASYAVLSDG